MNVFVGAKWWKFDFHTHTPASSDYGKGREQALLRQIEPREWLLNHMRAGIDCIGVTDHNSTKWIGELQSALVALERDSPDDFRPLTLFPGVEITVNGGVHLLALFEPGTPPERVQSLLGEVRYRGIAGESSEAAEGSIFDAVSAAARCDALPILAHVDEEKGAFHELSGNTLGPLLDLHDLVAMEVRDPNLQMPQLYLDRKLRWARILSTDSHHPTGGESGRYPGSHFTWVKMGKPCLDQLKLALLDGDRLSVRRSDECQGNPNDVAHDYIVSLEIRDAAKMGRGRAAVFEFSPWMNAVIGGRGTGKSTAVHFARGALGKGKELKDLTDDSLPRTIYEGFMGLSPKKKVEDGLTPNTEIKLVLVRDDRVFRVTWRPSGSPPLVEIQDGDRWLPAETQDLERFAVRIFSQGQLLEMAKGDSKALMRLVDAGADVGSLKNEVGELGSTYRTLRSKVRELGQRLEARDRLRAELDDVTAKLAKLEKSNHAAVLKEHQRRRRQIREVERQKQDMEGFIERVRDVLKTAFLSDPPEGVFGPDDAETLLAITTLSEAVDLAVANIRKETETLSSGVVTFQRATIQGPLGVAAAAAQAEYQKLVQDLAQAGMSDPSDYGRLVQERQRLEEQLRGLDAIFTERADLELQSDEVIFKIKAARRGIIDKRRVFLRQESSRQKHVTIELEPYGPSDTEGSLKRLCEIFSWQGQNFLSELWSGEGDTETGAIPSIYSDRSQPPTTDDLEARLEGFKKKLAGELVPPGGDFGARLRSSVTKETERRPEVLDELRLWFPEDTLRVRYSQSGDGRDFQDIQSGSPGQRSAALLAFVLSYGNEPLILDQPEDDLDNQLIYDLVVEQLRRTKQQRQFIVVTHNPNIVVNGDAEQVHVMNFGSGQCLIKQAGCLQEREIRNHVCAIMEGGRLAFQSRYRRLV